MSYQWIYDTAVVEGKKIEAIKALRTGEQDLGGIGLKEAKEIVEYLMGQPLPVNGSLITTAAENVNLKRDLEWTRQSLRDVQATNMSLSQENKALQLQLDLIRRIIQVDRGYDY